jgi:pimeloyl-ACP methyl ester carboxylesterase
MKKSFVLVLSILSLVVFIDHVSAKEMTVKSADGIPIAYQVRGKGDIALVFVHGWCCNKGFWDAQVPYFSKHYQVVTLDLAGHGESGSNRKEWTMQAFGHDAAAVVKELKLNKVILIGHSMGGPVIAEAARLLPKQVIGLVGVDTLINVEQKFTKEQFEQLMAPMRKDFARGTENFLRMWMFTPKTDAKLIEKIVKVMSSAPPEVGIQSFEGMFKQDLVAVLKEVKVPIRCINADKLPTDIEAGKRHAVSFDVKIMKGAGHFLHMEDPETFNRLLEETVKELIGVERRAESVE